MQSHLKQYEFKKWDKNLFLNSPHIEKQIMLGESAYMKLMKASKELESLIEQINALQEELNELREDNKQLEKMLDG